MLLFFQTKLTKMTFISFLNIVNSISILLNFLLIVVILLRSPNEQSLQENLGPFQIFESSSKAERSLDNIIVLLAVVYFCIGLLLAMKRYF